MRHPAGESAGPLDPQPSNFIMNTSFIRTKRFLIVVLSMFVLASVARAADEEGFEPMCNEKSLDGWVAMNGAEFEVVDDMVVCTGRTNWPTWLRSEEVFENFVLRLEYKTYWGAESGVFFAAPTDGRVSKIGFEFQINGFRSLTPYSTGAIFAAAAPLCNAPKRNEEQEYHDLEIMMNWPKLQIRLDGYLVQDVDCEKHSLLRYKQRLGHIGFPCRGKRVDFRNVRIKRLPDQVRDEWKSMLNGKSLDGWTVSDKCSATWTVDKEGVLVSDNGHGYLISDEQFYNCEFQTYVNTTYLANGGIFFGWITGGGRGFEIQVEDVHDSNDPTGSIYGVARANNLPRKQGEWSLLHVILKDNVCVVRVDGVTVAQSDQMSRRRWGSVALQMHRNNATVYWKDMKIRDLPLPEKPK
jgi:hypothetical protein